MNEFFAVFCSAAATALAALAAVLFTVVGVMQALSGDWSSALTAAACAGLFATIAIGTAVLMAHDEI